MAVLYIVSTPIGNLGDITQRAIEVILSSQLILSEDTRNTKKLLSLLNIDYNGKEFVSYYDNIESIKAPFVIDKIISYESAVLVSDAGTPLINDPGYKLIKLIKSDYDEDIKIEIIPGPSAVISALILSGFPPDKFCFLGYLPRKSSQTRELLNSIANINQIQKTTFVAFESPYRIAKTLTELDKYFSDKIKVAVCNEMTKKFEKTYVGSPSEVLGQLGNKKIKGEVTLVMNLNI